MDVRVDGDLLRFGGQRQVAGATTQEATVDLACGVIRVERSWDLSAGVQEPKPEAGTRKVPIVAVLRDVLIEHRMSQGRDGGGLVFGVSATPPFAPSGVRRRALAAWVAAGLEPIGLHECRHTFASLSIVAGVNAKALSTYMGHANIALTMDRYGHLMPGNEDEAAVLLNDYLAGAQAEAVRAVA